MYNKKFNLLESSMKIPQKNSLCSKNRSQLNQKLKLFSTCPPIQIFYLFNRFRDYSARQREMTLLWKNDSEKLHISVNAWEPQWNKKDARKANSRISCDLIRQRNVNTAFSTCLRIFLYSFDFGNDTKLFFWKDRLPPTAPVRKSILV